MKSIFILPLFLYFSSALTTSVQKPLNNGTLFVQASILNKPGSMYWSLNGTGSAVTSNYVLALQYWEDLAGNISANYKKYENIITLVDSCVDNICQKVTLELIDDSIKNYQISTNNNVAEIQRSNGEFPKENKVEEKKRYYQSNVGNNTENFKLKKVSNFYHTLKKMLFYLISYSFGNLVLYFKGQRYFNYNSHTEGIFLESDSGWTIFARNYDSIGTYNSRFLEENIKCVLDAALNTIPDPNITGFCKHVSHDSLNMDIRFFARNSGGLVDPWGLPCSTIGDDWSIFSHCL